MYSANEMTLGFICFYFVGHCLYLTTAHTRLENGFQTCLLPLRAARVFVKMEPPSATLYPTAPPCCHMLAPSIRPMANAAQFSNVLMPSVSNGHTVQQR